MTSIFAGHVMITGQLRVLTPLHAGTGERAPDQRLWEAEGGENGGPLEPELSLIQRDHEKKPYLPGSSIKGALRSYARINDADPTRIKSLFGEVKDTSQTGTMGALTVFGATWSKGASSAISARVRLDAGRGVADGGGLFHEEEISPGSVFDFRARYVRSLEDKSDGLLSELLDALGKGFIALGGGTAAGAGQVKLEGLKLEEFKIDQATGELKGTGAVALPQPTNSLKPAGHRFLLRLEASGPYLSLDQDHARELRRKRSAGEDTINDVQLKGALDPDGNPALAGDSLKGALRARAQFLARLRHPAEADAIINDLFGPHVTGDDGAARARLEIQKITCTNAGSKCTATSVQLDDFSGAPLDGALFSVECKFAPHYEIDLWLSPQAEKASQDFLDDVLLPDLLGNGIKLGYGKARGFGWFKVSKRED